MEKLIEDIDVSVIVPMYNVENLIAETLESLKKNDCKLEVILINDGSTDKTMENAKLAVENDPRFIFIDQPNQGVSTARNIGLQHSRGEYITFVDADDILAEGALDLLYREGKDKNSDFVYGAVKKFNKDKSWYLDAHVRHGVFEPGYKNKKDNPEILFFIGVGGKLIHKSILKDQFFPEGIKFSEDTVVIFNAYVSAKNIYTVSDTVYFYRERDVDVDGASATQKQKTSSYDYLTDVFETILICNSFLKNDKSLSHQDKTLFLKKYYDRIFAYELWPLFINSLRYENKKNKQVFVDLLHFLKKHSREDINSNPAIRLYLIKVLIDNCFYVKMTSFKSYRKMLKYLFDTLDKDIHRICAHKSMYGKKWNDAYILANKNFTYSFFYFLRLRIQKKFHWNVKNNISFVKKYFFSVFKLLPVSRNKIIFATGNLKPMAENFESIHRDIISNEKYDKYKIYKFLGPANTTRKILSRYYHLATSEVVFLEDYYKPIYGLKFPKNTQIVQLWHACGAFKKFAHDALGKGDSNTKELESNAHNMYTSVLVSAEDISELYSSAFKVNKSRVLSLGVPRTDLFFDNNRKAAVIRNIRSKYPFLNSTYNILYAPTFRGGPSVRGTFEFKINWSELAMLPDNYRLIIKLHPIVKKIIPEIPDFVKKKVLLLPNTENVNDWMIFCDMLITDYSSLIFEYSLLNKPIVYYPYDLEEYYDERGFYFPYETYVYGDIAENSKDLILAIKKAESRMGLYTRKKREFKEKFMRHCDGMSTSRIVNEIINRV